MKISAALIAWNEVQTIDLCLKSLQGFADEVIVADTGSFDGTVEKAEECFSHLGLNGEVLNVKTKTLGQARLAAIGSCTHPWILLIDSNLVISVALKKELRQTSEKGYLGMVRSLNLMGDYEHYFTTLPFHSHHDVLFHKTMVVWLDDFDRPVSIVRRLPVKNWAVNLSRVRPAWRYWYRGEAFMLKGDREWRTPNNQQRNWLRMKKYASLEEYVETEQGMALGDVKEVAPSWFLELLRKFARPLRPKLRMRLPETILEELKNPRYKLIYENGEIVGRHPSL